MFVYEIRGSEATVRRCSVKEVFLKFPKIHRKTSVPQSLINNVKEETYAQVFVYEFCENFD